MFVQPQTQLRLTMEQIIAAILLLPSDEQDMLKKIVLEQPESDSSSIHSQNTQITGTQSHESNLIQAMQPELNGHMDTIETNGNDIPKSKSSKKRTWSEFVKNIDEFAVDIGIEDLSINHDHYLYGLPKREII